MDHKRVRKKKEGEEEKEEKEVARKEDQPENERRYNSVDVKSDPDGNR